jgi:hypothetical protein
MGHSEETMKQIAMALALALAGCSGPEAQPPKLLDTGWFETTSHSLDPENCPDKFVTTIPENGDGGWYWRDRPQFFAATANHAMYDAWLQDASGQRLDTEMYWDDADGGAGLEGYLRWEGYLEAETVYTMGLTDCAYHTEITFTTSALGKPLSDDPSDLIGQTFVLDLAEAYWVEPSLLGGVIREYFNEPILLGVQYADDDQIDLLGAMGETDILGGVSQNLGEETWAFPLADFTDAPFVSAPADRVVFTFQGYEFPAHDFLLEGTLSADGQRFGGGVLSGLVDTRNAGPLIGTSDDPNALCELAAGFGIACEQCPGGDPYCLFLKAVDLDGEVQSNLVLVQIDG